MLNAGAVGLSVTDGALSCGGSVFGGSSAGFVGGAIGFGLTVFGGSVCDDLLSSAGGICSIFVFSFSAGVEISVCFVLLLAGAVVGLELSLLSEKEVDGLSSGSVLSRASLTTVSCEELPVVCGFSILAQPEKERINAVKTAIPIAFLICKPPLQLHCTNTSEFLQRYQA